MLLGSLALLIVSCCWPSLASECSKQCVHLRIVTLLLCNCTCVWLHCYVVTSGCWPASSRLAPCKLARLVSCQLAPSWSRLVPCQLAPSRSRLGSMPAGRLVRCQLAPGRCPRPGCVGECKGMNERRADIEHFIFQKSYPHPRREADSGNRPRCTNTILAILFEEFAQLASRFVKIRTRVLGQKQNSAAPTNRGIGPDSPSKA